MLKIALPLLLILTACSQQASINSQIPLDSKTVDEYNARVASGNTATKINPVEEPIPLNQSDNRPAKQDRSYSDPRVILVPSFGYYHGW